MLMDGQPIHFRSPMEARQAGIETVYQTLALSPALSIVDNMFLGREIRAKGVAGSLFRKLDKAAMQKVAREKLSRARPAHHPEHQPAGRDPVRRPAPGRRGRACLPPSAARS